VDAVVCGDGEQAIAYMQGEGQFADRQAHQMWHDQADKANRTGLCHGRRRGQCAQRSGKQHPRGKGGERYGENDRHEDAR